MLADARRRLKIESTRSAMKNWNSIRFRISAAFVLFLLLVLVLGLFSLSQLGVVNQVSSDIRDRWLQSTRIIGDLNNYTSDYRAYEANNILYKDPKFRKNLDNDLEELSKSIDISENSYNGIAHDAAEIEIYRRFVSAWRAYEAQAQETTALARSGEEAQSVALYLTRSKQAYDLASDTLDALTKLTVQNASSASDRAAAAYRNAWVLLLGAVVAAVVVVGIGVAYISRVISNPLLGLADRMRSLASNDTTIDVEGTHRNDEIGEMARAIVVFRNNAVDLARSQQALSEQAAGLKERLDHERRLTAVQRNFVSMASHEFRTPLTVIDGHAQRLISLKANLTPSEIEDRARRVRRAVQLMTHVIDNLLDSSRLFEGEPGLDFRPADIALPRLLREICELHRDISPNVEIIEDFAQGPERIEGDVSLIYQALSNLLSNSVKYSPNGGVIAVSAHQAEGDVLISVADRGLGIPKADLANIFERYHRGSNVAGIVGTGVGLYLVKTVTTAHGGDVAVESREGEGARFTMRLPIRQSSTTARTLNS
jgi:signal transduction histidine kinase